MTKFTQQKQVPYTSQQFYNVVMDVGKYPRFLPWCDEARVRDTLSIVDAASGLVIADVKIGFGPFRETLVAYVTPLPDSGDGHCSVQVEYEKGPFKHLQNYWFFVPCEGGCTVNLSVDYEFNNILLQKTMGPLFNEAVSVMMNAFMKRAQVIYGSVKK